MSKQLPINIWQSLLTHWILSKNYFFNENFTSSFSKEFVFALNHRGQQKKNNARHKKSVVLISKWL